jgi:type IV secretion system protein TrbG
MKRQFCIFATALTLSAPALTPPVFAAPLVAPAKTTGATVGETRDIRLPVDVRSKATQPNTTQRPKQAHRKSARQKPHVHARTRSKPASPVTRILRANDAARVQPASDGFLNAVQSYAYSEGALYQVYASPGHITDIILQEGEQLTGSGPVAAGDTTRWVIGATTSGTGPRARVHIMVKPTRSDLATNLIINTNRRTYHLELRSSASIWMASLSWNYPQDLSVAIEAQAQADAERAPIAAGIDATTLRFNYEIRGDKPDWRPLRAFDDGRQTFIAFPLSISQGEMPPFFVIGPGGDLELVNTRVRGTWLIIDRLFDRAVLRLGNGKQAKSVEILRSSGKQGK